MMIEIPGKIPIRIYPFFWFIAIVIGWLNSFSSMTTIHLTLIKTAIWVVVITFSIIVHEYGHALSAVSFGQRAKIDLVGFGGVTHRAGLKLRFWKEFMIVLCGPLFGFGLALLSYFVLKKFGAGPMTMSRYLFESLFYVNVFWTFVNLLPVQPLDGGRLLSILLESIFGLKGIKIAYFISILIATAVGLFFFFLNAMLAGSLFLFLAFESYRAWKMSLPMRAQDQNEEAQKLLKKAEEELDAGRKAEALDKVRLVRSMTQSGVLYDLATYYEASLINEQGDYKAAYEILHPLKNRLDLKAWQLLQQLAYHTQHYDEAITLGNHIFSESPHYETAFINALCYAALNQPNPVVAWLTSAKRHGMSHLKVLLLKAEFDSIRKSAPFIKFLQDL